MKIAYLCLNMVLSNLSLFFLESVGRYACKPPTSPPPGLAVASSACGSAAGCVGKGPARDARDAWRPVSVHDADRLRHGVPVVSFLQYELQHLENLLVRNCCRSLVHCTKSSSSSTSFSNTLMSCTFFEGT